MRKLINRWTILMALVAATLFGVQHRLATLSVHAPALVSAASIQTAH